MQTSTQGMKCEKITWNSSSLKYFPIFFFEIYIACLMQHILNLLNTMQF